MNCEQLNEFNLLTEEVLLHVDEQQYEKVLQIFIKYKVKIFQSLNVEGEHPQIAPQLLNVSNEHPQNVPNAVEKETFDEESVQSSNEGNNTIEMESQDESERSEETQFKPSDESSSDNGEKKKREKFFKALLESVRSNSVETSSISSSDVILASYTCFSDLLEAIKEKKKELELGLKSVVQRSIELGRLLWIAKTFNRFNEAFNQSGYSRTWANFLVNLYKIYCRHNNISKSTLPLHVLRANMKLLYDIAECLPEFDQIS